MPEAITMKRVITEEVVVAEFQGGHRRIDANSGHAIVTVGAWSKAHERGVVIDGPGAETDARPTSAKREAKPAA